MRSLMHIIYEHLEPKLQSWVDVVMPCTILNHLMVHANACWSLTWKLGYCNHVMHNHLYAHTNALGLPLVGIESIQAKQPRRSVENQEVFQASVLENQMTEITVSNYDVSCYSIGHRLRHWGQLPTSNASRGTNAMGLSISTSTTLVFSNII